jgi:hypothetical protein
MIVEPENKLILFMTNPASAQGRLGNTGTDPFKERKGSVERVVMAIFTGRKVFRVFFGFLLLVKPAMYTVS